LIGLKLTLNLSDLIQRAGIISSVISSLAIRVL
jgi:hypothetical protein